MHNTRTVKIISTQVAFRDITASNHVGSKLHNLHSLILIGKENWASFNVSKEKYPGYEAVVFTGI